MYFLLRIVDRFYFDSWSRLFSDLDLRLAYPRPRPRPRLRGSRPRPRLVKAGLEMSRDHDSSLENSKSGYFTSKIYFIFSAPNAYILTNNGFHQIVRPTRAKPPCCLHGPIKTAPTNERCHCLYFVGNSVIDKNRKKIFKICYVALTIHFIQFALCYLLY